MLLSYAVVFVVLYISEEPIINVNMCVVGSVIFQTPCNCVHIVNIHYLTQFIKNKLINLLTTWLYVKVKRWTLQCGSKRRLFYFRPIAFCGYHTWRMRHVTTELCKFQCHLQLHTNRTHTAKKNTWTKGYKANWQEKWVKKCWLFRLTKDCR